MQRTTSKYLKFIYCLGLLFFVATSHAQKTNTGTSLLASYIQSLEERFQIKFSYADADISSIRIDIPKTKDLGSILDNITNQTRLKIQKLNDRYYTITDTQTISICGTVLDNFKQNTISGATIQILGTGKAVATDTLGNFSLNNIPANAKIQIKHAG